MTIEAYPEGNTVLLYKVKVRPDPEYYV